MEEGDIARFFVQGLGLALVAKTCPNRSHAFKKVNNNQAFLYVKRRSNWRSGRLRHTWYISAAQRMGWDLTAGHMFLVVTAEGGRGSLPLPAARMTTALQGHLQAAGQPSHFKMPSSA